MTKNVGKVIINPDGTANISGLTRIVKKDEDESLEGIIEHAAYEDTRNVAFVDPPTFPVETFKNEVWEGLLKRDEVIINKWMDTIGISTIRVNLIDKKGNVVTWVPPLTYGITTDSSRLFDAAVNYQQTRETHEGAANARLVKFFGSVIRSRAAPLDHVKQWKVLLQLFGTVGKDTIETLVPDSGEAEETEYDDW